MRPRFHTSNGSGRFPQRRRVRVVPQKRTTHGLCLYLVLCFALGLGLGFGLGLGLNPGFGLSLGLGLGTGLSVRWGRSLDMPQIASLDTVHQESADSIAMEDVSVGSILDMSDENLEQITNIRAISKYEYGSWEDVREDAGDEKVIEESEESGQEYHQTTGM